VVKIPAKTNATMTRGMGGLLEAQASNGQ